MTRRDREFIGDAARRLKPVLEQARTVALCTHVNPDGDGIGAEICLHRYLRSIDVESRIINTEALPLRYRFLDSDGAVEVYGCATHALLSGDCCARLEAAPFTEVCVTNTVAIPAERRIDNLKILSIGDLLAKAITYNHDYQSVSSLFPD